MKNVSSLKSCPQNVIFFLNRFSTDCPLLEFQFNCLRNDTSRKKIRTVEDYKGKRKFIPVVT